VAARADADLKTTADGYTGACSVNVHQTIGSYEQDIVVWGYAVNGRCYIELHGNTLPVSCGSAAANCR
jgi:hypothetical protein